MNASQARSVKVIVGGVSRSVAVVGVESWRVVVN